MFGCHFIHCENTEPVLHLVECRLFFWGVGESGDILKGINIITLCYFGQSEDWTFCVALATCTCNIWSNLHFGTCQISGIISSILSIHYLWDCCICFIRHVLFHCSQGLFERLDDPADNSVTSRVDVSYFEIYNERVRDLLQPELLKQNENYSLKVREHPKDGPYVKGELIIDV